MIDQALIKMIQEFNDLPPCSVDDICDGLVGASDSDFIRKSDAIDILNRYVKAVYAREKLNLKLEITQAHINVMQTNLENSIHLRNYIFS